MIEIAIVALIGIVGGAMIGVQSPMAVGMGLRIGPASASMIMHAGGAIVSLFLLLARGGETISAIRTVPWYMLGCGVCGVLLLLSVTYTMPRLGVGTAIALLLVGQLTAAMVIDQFGLFGADPVPIDVQKLAGVMLLLAGAFLMLRSA